MDITKLSKLALQIREGQVLDLENKNLPPFVEVSLLQMFSCLPTIETVSTHLITNGKATNAAYLTQLAAVRNLTSAIIPLAFVPNFTKFIGSGIGRNIILKRDCRVLLISVVTPVLGDTQYVMDYWIRCLAKAI